MERLHKCSRTDCRTIEVPNTRWWVVGTMVGYGSRPQMYFMLHFPGIPLLHNERLVCGESCLTREIALWTMDEQNRRRQAALQATVLEEIERQL